MIYLIGGPPKCGKTTLAKRLSKSKGIPWVSTDTLQCVIQPYLNKKESKKYGFEILNMDNDFNNQVNKAVDYLTTA